MLGKAPTRREMVVADRESGVGLMGDRGGRVVPKSLIPKYAGREGRH